MVRDRQNGHAAEQTEQCQEPEESRITAKPEEQRNSSLANHAQ